MGTAGSHLGPLKSPTRTKSSSTWSPENRGPTTAPSARKEGSGKEKRSIRRVVWTPCSGIQKIN